MTKINELSAGVNNSNSPLHTATPNTSILQHMQSGDISTVANAMGISYEAAKKRITRFNPTAIEILSEVILQRNELIKRWQTKLFLKTKYNLN